MNTITTIADAINENPRDVVSRLAVADALEESGDEARAEATRIALKIQLCYPNKPSSSDFDRLATMNEKGFSPILPIRKIHNIPHYWIVGRKNQSFWISERFKEVNRANVLPYVPQLAEHYHIDLLANLFGIKSPEWIKKGNSRTRWTLSDTDSVYTLASVSERIRLKLPFRLVVED